ncbi:MAG TPA: adenosylcobalamin-dependent ribonucleoside-diphosphate reductase, partial [Dermatophilaceae bacterium]|nr:adenosylcobalamin-dependent ribonucleoside-diphosphate reductase [Dermatophilaceae bacterium]
FDAATTVVAQGGKMRGANLASLSVHHPDILEFIDAKRGLGRLHNFNLSALVTDAFMHSLATKGEVELVSPVSKRVVGTLPATQIWERISESAWRTGDPGVLFVDRINAVNPLVDHLGPIMTTNPCGEQTLYPYEASNLGSVNLAAFVKDGTVDWAALEETVSCAVRLLDNAIDASVYPDPRVTAMARANRRLGLGVMGYADLLIALGIRYDSGAAMQVIDQLGTVITVAAWSASRALADERGTFPNWEHCRLPSKARNCAITTIAPTGTISMIAGCSSGIEPRFAPSWTKDVMYEGGVSYIDENLVQDLLRCREVSREQAVELVTTTPVCELRLPEAVAAKYRYAHDIAPEWHVRAVARWQRHVDNAVSKTVNLQRTATATEVGAAFELAWRLGCKGLSVYRQGSRERDLQEAAGHHAELEPPRQSRQLVAQGTP